MSLQPSPRTPNLRDCNELPLLLVLFLLLTSGSSIEFDFLQNIHDCGLIRPVVTGKPENRGEILQEALPRAFTKKSTASFSRTPNCDSQSIPNRFSQKVLAFRTVFLPKTAEEGLIFPNRNMLNKLDERRNGFQEAFRRL